MATDVDGSAGDITPSDLLKLTDGVRRGVLEATLEVARKVGRSARQGKKLGALFVMGDSSKVLEYSQQLVLNPFEGHDEADRMITNPDAHEMVMEFAKLDGAFVIRGDGFIRTAGTFLRISETDVNIPSGLGARHTAAAGITARTYATAMSVSAADGEVRAFSGGELVMQMDPEVPFIPVA
jgi:DNA integrity scanning protein DisA with diadenylate cyclase activity